MNNFKVYHWQKIPGKCFKPAGTGQRKESKLTPVRCQGDLVEQGQYIWLQEKIPNHMVSWHVFKPYKNGIISAILLKSVPTYKKLPYTLYAVTVDCQYLIMKHKCYKLISQWKQIRELAYVILLQKKKKGKEKRQGKKTMWSLSHAQ